MRLAAAIAIAGLTPLQALSQAVAPVPYRCFVESGGARTEPPSRLTLSQFTLHWRPATGNSPPTLKVLHEYFAHAPLTAAAPGTTTIAGSWVAEDTKGRPRGASVTAAAADDGVIAITLVEPFDLTGQTARFEVTAQCKRQ